MTNAKYLIVSLFALAACSDSQTSNTQVSAQYQMKSNVGQINYRITDEVVTGTACSGSFLSIPVGATEYVSAGIDTNTQEGKAKAAAVYKALYGEEPGKLGLDIIAQPQFRIDRKRIPLISNQTCATVMGYRAVVSGIKN